jgi:hypothetical protein
MNKIIVLFRSSVKRLVFVHAKGRKAGFLQLSGKNPACLEAGKSAKN